MERIVYYTWYGHIAGFLSGFKLTGSDSFFVRLGDGNPISLQERACIETIYPENDKYVSR